MVRLDVADTVPSTAPEDTSDMAVVVSEAPAASDTADDADSANASTVSADTADTAASVTVVALAATVNVPCVSVDAAPTATADAAVTA
jgi:hypothetical protein